MYKKGGGHYILGMTVPLGGGGGGGGGRGDTLNQRGHNIQGYIVRGTV